MKKARFERELIAFFKSHSGMVKSYFIHTFPGREMVPFNVEIVKAGVRIRGVFGLEKQIFIPYNSTTVLWSCRRCC